MSNNDDAGGILVGWTNIMSASCGWVTAFDFIFDSFVDITGCFTIQSAVFISFVNVIVICCFALLFSS